MHTANTALELFFSWVFTPVGATLTLLMIVMGAVSGILRLLGRTGRILKTCLTVTMVLLFVWIMSGVLGAMGIPVREWLIQLGNCIPKLLDAFTAFITRLVDAAT